MIETNAQADAIPHAYQIQVKGWSPLEGGSLNAGYRVDAAQGDFHLKCYDGRIYLADDIRRSLDTQEYAGRSGIPVPAVKVNVRGDPITDIPGVGSVVLSSFIEGIHHPRGSIPGKAAGAMGRALGTLQGILARLVLSLDFLRNGRLLPEADDFLAGYHETGHLTEQEALALAPLRLYLECTSAWPITARYEDTDAYQARWDRFIGEPSSWWEDHSDELTVRLLSLVQRSSAADP